MINNFSKNVTKIFYITFSVVIGLLLFNVLFFNKWFNYSPIIVLLLVVIGVGVLITMYMGLEFLNKFISKNHYKTFIVCMVIMFFVQLIFAKMLAVQTGGDFGEIYRAALTMTREGNLDDFERYLYLFPNNLGLYLTLMIPFRIFNRIGFTDFYLIASVINIVMIDTAVVFTFLYCEKLWGKTGAWISFVLSSSCALYYFLTPIFYTDTMSICFAPVILYLSLKIINSKKYITIMSLSLLMGVIACYGFKIKATVCIVLIAVIIQMFLNSNIKKSLISASLIIVAFITFSFMFDLVAYMPPLSKADAYNKNTPYTHWVMMGMQGDGAYSPEEYEISFGEENIITDSSAVAEINKEIIKERLNDFGFFGYLRFLNTKGVRSFGSGNGQASEFLNLRPRYDTFLHEFCLQDGKYYGLFDYFTQSYHIGLMILGLIGAIIGLGKKDENIYIAPFVSMFGLYLFLLLWEANQRYIVNFIPVFIIMAVQGAMVARPVYRDFIKNIKSKFIRGNNA